VSSSDNANALMVAAAQRRYAPLESLRPETPKRLKGVLDRALALSPGDRFQSAREIVDELEDWLTSTGVRVKPSELAELVSEFSETTAGGTRRPRPLDEDPPPTISLLHEARTVVQVAPSKQSLVSRANVETVPSRRAEVSRSDVQTDPSAAVTPVGTPPVGRRATVDGPIARSAAQLAAERGKASRPETIGGIEVDLVPTVPERVAPDIEAIMQQSRQNLTKGKPSLSAETKIAPVQLAEVTSPARPMLSKEEMPEVTPQMLPEVTPQMLPEMTPPLTRGALSSGPAPVITAIVPGPRAQRPLPKSSRWPWVVLILMLLPLGAVAAAIELLPPEHPVRVQVLTLVAPMLEKIEHLRR
jgi:hypothetical protein